MRVPVLILSGLIAAGFAGSALAQHKSPPKTPPRAAPRYDEAKLKALEAKLARSPKDQKLKLEVAEANYQVGYKIEYDTPGLTPREKYRGALAKYRRALQLNPKHAKAKAEKEQIENIYRQMGMPIPQ